MVDLKMSTSKGIALIAIALSVVVASCNYSDGNPENEMNMKNTKEMPTFVIEREIENVGNSTDTELKTISQKSNSVLQELGSDIQWQHSYIVGNKSYCVYKARDKSIIREHARRVGAPANSISEVSAIIDPTSAD